MADTDRNRNLREGPEPARPDWDLAGGETTLPEDSGVPIEGEQPGDLPEEDNDNPYEESDEALPEDDEEKVIDQNPGREETRFDDV